MSYCNYIQWEGSVWGDKYYCKLVHKELDKQEVEYKCKKDCESCPIYKNRP